MVTSDLSYEPKNICVPLILKMKGETDDRVTFFFFGQFCLPNLFKSLEYCIILL